jgi:hypothetical protein
MLAALSAATLAGRESRAATVVPALRVESRYDDNIDQQVTATTDIATLLRPELACEGSDEITSWGLQARRSFIAYTRNPRLAPQTDLAAVFLKRRMSSASTVAVDYQYSRSRDPINLEPVTVPRQGPLSRNQASVRGEVWRGEAEARFNQWSYAHTDLQDGESRYWMVGVYPIRTPGGPWVASFRSRDLRIGGRSAILSNSGMFGWRRSHTRQLSSELQLGVADVDLRDGTPSTRRLAALVDVTARLSPYAPAGGLHLSLAHDIATTAEVALSRDLSYGEATVKWQRLLDVEGGIYRDPTLTERWGLGVADTLGGGKVLAMAGSYDRTRPLRATGTHARVYRASVSRPSTTSFSRARWTRARWSVFDGAALVWHLPPRCGDFFACARAAAQGTSESRKPREVGEDVGTVGLVSCRHDDSRRDRVGKRASARRCRGRGAGVQTGALGSDSLARGRGFVHLGRADPAGGGDGPG